MKSKPNEQDPNSGDEVPNVGQGEVKETLTETPKLTEPKLPTERALEDPEDGSVSIEEEEEFKTFAQREFRSSEESKGKWMNIHRWCPQ